MPHSESLYEIFISQRVTEDKKTRALSPHARVTFSMLKKEMASMRASAVTIGVTERRNVLISS